MPGDTILLAGGGVWDETLAPRRSGARSRPIRFSSWGDGLATIRGGIFLVDVSWLAFERLAITGAGQGVLASVDGSGVRSIQIERLEIADVVTAINSANPLDAYWTISDNTIARTADSAIILTGSRMRVIGNRIVDAGTSPTVEYATHGIYSKSSGVVIARNRIARARDSGISTRSPDARIEWNAIRDTETGIGYFQGADAAGTTIVRHNTIRRVAVGIYLDGSTTEKFLVHHNSIFAASTGISTRPARRLWVWGNTLRARTAQEHGGAHVDAPPGTYGDTSVPTLALVEKLRTVTVRGRRALEVHVSCRSAARKRCRMLIDAATDDRGGEDDSAQLVVRRGRKGFVRLIVSRRKQGARPKPTSVRVRVRAVDASQLPTVTVRHTVVRL